MRYMTEEQYNDIQRLLRHLNTQNYALSEVEIEVVLFDNIEYILNYYRKGESKGNFYTLLSASIKRKIYTKLRDNKSHYDKLNGLITEEEEIVRGSDYLVLSEEFYTELDKMIKKMPVLEANILYLHIMGESSRSTSKILEVSRHKVMSKLRNTKAQLRKKLGDYGEFHNTRQYS